MAMEYDQTELAALHRIDRARGTVLLWIVVVALLEAALLITFALLADFTNRTHVLLLIASVLIYGTVGLSVVALGAYVKLCSLRVLSGIQALRDERAGGH